MSFRTDRAVKRARLPATSSLRGNDGDVKVADAPTTAVLALGCQDVVFGEVGGRHDSTGRRLRFDSRRTFRRLDCHRPSTQYGSRFRCVPPLDFKWMRFGPIFRVMTSQHALLFLQTFTGNFPDTRRQPLPRRKRARAATCRLDLGALRR